MLGKQCGELILLPYLSDNLAMVTHAIRFDLIKLTLHIRVKTLHLQSQFCLLFYLPDTFCRCFLWNRKIQLPPILGQWDGYHLIQVCFEVHDVRVYFKENKFMNKKPCVSMSSNVSRTSEILTTRRHSRFTLE